MDRTSNSSRFAKRRWNRKHPPVARSTSPVGQRREAGPQRRGATCATKDIGTAVIINHFHGIGGHRHVGEIPVNRRAVVQRHAHGGLPGGNRVIGADAAGCASVIAPVPNGFRRPGPAPAAHRQTRPTHTCHINAIHRYGTRGGIHRLATRVGVGIAGGLAFERLRAQL